MTRLPRLRRPRLFAAGAALAVLAAGGSALAVAGSGSNSPAAVRAADAFEASPATSAFSSTSAPSTATEAPSKSAPTTLAPATLSPTSTPVSRPVSRPAATKPSGTKPPTTVPPKPARASKHPAPKSTHPKRESPRPHTAATPRHSQPVAVAGERSTRGPAKPQTSTTGHSRPGIAAAVLAQLNAERAAHGLPALTVSAALVRAAHKHNLAMAKANTMGHQMPGEPELGARVLAAGYNFHYAGENVGFNGNMTTSGAKQLETIMYNETPPNDGHRRNILDKHFKQAGVDIWLDEVHDRLWLTVDFGATF